MKTLLVFILLFGILSCSEKEEIKKEEKPTIETTSLSPEEFQNTVATKVNEAHNLIQLLQQLDEQDASPETIVSEASKHLGTLETLLNDLNNLIPSGELGNELKELSTQYLASKKAIITVYIDFAPQLSIESEWSDEDYALWTSNAEPFFGVSDQIFAELSELQTQFLIKNNISQPAL